MSDDPFDIKRYMESYRIPDPALPKLNLPRPNIPAKWTYERLVRSINNFEAQLADNEEIGGRFVGGPGSEVFHIDDVGYWGPDMIIFHGTNQHGKPVQLLQHYTQLNVLLTALPVEKDKPRRIGFALVNELEKDSDE